MKEDRRIRQEILRASKGPVVVPKRRKKKTRQRHKASGENLSTAGDDNSFFLTGLDGDEDMEGNDDALALLGDGN